MEASVVALVVLAVLTTVAVTWALRPRWQRGGPLAMIWNLVEVSFAVFLMMGMLYAATTQVIVRYWLSQQVSLPWTEEFSRLLLVWAAFWGAAMVQRSDEQIAVTVAFDRLPPRVQHVVRLLGDLLALGFLALMAWEGWWLAGLQVNFPMITLDLPTALFDYALPICGALMLVHTVVLTVRRAQGRAMHGAPAYEV